MADGFHVNGPAFLFTGTGGGSSLELLGTTVDGVRITITKNVQPIITDVFGPDVPHDLQDTLEVATITAPIIISYRQVLKRVINRGDRPAQGTMNSPGLVLGQSGAAFRVGISSAYDEPWMFYSCIVRPDMRTNLATKAGPFELQLFAWPWLPYTATTAYGAPLYTRAIS